MSSHDKDPLEKQDTPSESSESHSDSEVDKAEENLEHLKIEERLTKDYLDESKPLDSKNQEGILATKCELLNEPIAGSSGLQEPCPKSSDSSSDPKLKVVSLSDPQELKEKNVEENVGPKMVEESHSSSEEGRMSKEMDENIGERVMRSDSDTTSSTPPFIQSSTGVTPTSMLQDISPVAGPSRLRGEIDYSKLPINAIVNRFFRQSSLQSSSSRRHGYATDSANTSADVSEIRSEIADISTEGSLYQDAPESFEKDQSPSYVSAVERQSSESSDTNISDIQEELVPPATSSSSSVSASTPSGEQGHRAYLEQLQREAEARGVQLSTSSGIGSTNQSELVHLQAWNAAGEIGYHRNNVDDPDQDVSDNVAQVGDVHPLSESAEQILGDKQSQDSDLFEQKQQNEGRKEPKVPEEAMSGCVPRRARIKENVQACSVEEGSPSKRRRSSRCMSDSTRAEKGAYEKHRPRFKTDMGKKSKIASSKSNLASQSSSESTEPKSSSSDELPRKESPEIISTSVAKEFSKSDSRKPWQKPGRLRSMQHATISSMDSVPEEEEGQALREQDRELMETKYPTPEKMEATLEEGTRVVAEKTEFSESIVSGDQAYVSEAEGTLKEHEHSFEDSEFERSVGKSKRESKLSNSPPSDEKLDSSPPRAATSRPKKKAKSEKMPGKTRRTRHDSGGTVPKSVSLDSLQQSDSVGTPDISDYTPSDYDEEEETAL